MLQREHYQRAEQSCPYCGVTMPRPLRRGGVPSKTCGAPDCHRKHRNAIGTKSVRTRKARAIKHDLCLRCYRRRRAKPKAGEKPGRICRICKLQKTMQNIRYDARLPEREWAQARTLEIYIEPRRKKLPPPVGDPIEV